MLSRQVTGPISRCGIAALPTWLRGIPTGQPGCVFTEDPSALTVQLQAILERDDSPFTIVSSHWTMRSSTSDELVDVVRALADATLTLYPDLYSTALDRLQADSWQPSDEDFSIQQAATTIAEVSPSWLRRAIEACRDFNRPWFSDIPLPFQARQLALALDPARLIVAVTVQEIDVRPARLLGLARAAEWLACNTSAKVMLILRDALAGCSDLDAVTYHALRVSDPDPIEAETDAVQRCSREGGHPRSHPTCTNGSPIGSTAGFTNEPPEGGPPLATPPPGSALECIRDALQCSVWPIVGRPHPSSPAEQSLARSLLEDDELRPLFEWNQPLKTVHGSCVVVDLLWRTGRTIVEVDGYRFHSQKRAFAQDRQRDWELLLTGYRVLRLTGEEALRTPTRALEKMRELVRYVGKGLRS